MSSLTPMHLPDEILLKIIRRLPLKAVLSMSAVNRRLNWMITGPGMSNLHFNLLLAGLQEYSYEDDRLERISNYCSRWNNLGSSTKIPLTFARYNVRSMQVNEGYYLLALLRSEDGKHALHFGRLPSPDPLVQNHVEEPWKIVPNVPNYHALAICPVKDLLALAKIRSDRMLLEVFLFNMHTGEEYYETGDSEPTPKMVWNSGSLGEIDKVKLLLTSRRLAAVVKMSATQYNSVLVWDWEDGTLLVNVQPPRASAAAFIDEYRLLTADSMSPLVLWDFAPKQNPRQVRFKLGEEIGAVQDIKRSYELAHVEPPFRADPEAGIVVLTPSLENPDLEESNTRFVIPVNTFLEETRKVVEWEDWKNYVTKLHPSTDPGGFYLTLHNHVLCLERGTSRVGETVFNYRIFDFSLYFRKKVWDEDRRNEKQQLKLGYRGCYDDGEVSSLSRRSMKIPLAVVNSGTIVLPENHLRVFHTENGILFTDMRPQNAQFVMVQDYTRRE